MSWKDMGLYWAWMSLDAMTPPPTVKKREYVQIRHNTGLTMALCVGVFDDDKYTPMNRGELEWHVKQGATIEGDLHE
jgi:hypothetical protein